MESESKNNIKIWVNGTFDVFHPGHLALLKYASNKGELHVGLDSDRRVKEKNCDINSFTPQAPEQKLSYWYLIKKEPIINDTNGIDIFKKHFDILNIDLIKPYLITSHCYGRKWYSDFIPEDFSINKEYE